MNSKNKKMKMLHLIGISANFYLIIGDFFLLLLKEVT